MKYIWSPWRMKYIVGEKNKEGCVFCQEAACQDGPENLIVFRGKFAYVILNQYPYTSGHLMVVPYAHRSSLDQLASQDRIEIIELTSCCLEVLRREYNAEGFNIGMNIGASAGAGILEHVHMHIVPRWGGDTNFMSALGATRVLPESLEETYTRIKKAWIHQSSIKKS